MNTLARRMLAAGAASIVALAPHPFVVPAYAITPPVVDPAAMPPGGEPGPEEPLTMRGPCAITGVLPGSDLGAPPGPQAFMNLPELWKSAGKGAGITVAVIDTGVSPSPRLPRLRGGGDYVVAGGDGLTDCDAHGTVVASIIAGAPSEADGFVGVAPDVEVLSIRQSSAAYSPEHPSSGDMQADRRAGTVSSLARAVVRAADSGARVINMSVVACVPVLKPVDQTTLGAALRYAAVEKDVVLVAAAGNVANPDCSQNPDIDATNVEDPRNWTGVVTISTPSWFSQYVLSVSATDAAGQPAVDDKGTEVSLSGPWVGVGAPGLFVEGFNEKGELINSTFNAQAGTLKPMSGTSYSTAYVSGLAALVRAKYPDLTAAQVIRRIEATAHPPAAVVDNRLGYGTIDPLAALNFDISDLGPAKPAELLTRPLVAPAPPPPPDRRPMVIALVGSAVLAAGLLVMLGVRRMAGRDTRTKG